VERHRDNMKNYGKILTKCKYPDNELTRKKTPKPWKIFTKVCKSSLKVTPPHLPSQIVKIFTKKHACHDKSTIKLCHDLATPSLEYKNKMSLE